jgi:hypothetical protein
MTVQAGKEIAKQPQQLGGALLSCSGLFSGEAPVQVASGSGLGQKSHEKERRGNFAACQKGAAEPNGLIGDLSTRAREEQGVTVRAKAFSTRRSEGWCLCCLWLGYRCCRLCEEDLDDPFADLGKPPDVEHCQPGGEDIHWEREGTREEKEAITSDARSELALMAGGMP